MSQRTFTPNAGKIDKLRVQKGWALPDLARKAGVSNRTIDSIMLGRSVVISTMSKVAKALDAPVESLIADFEPEQPVREKRFVVSLRLCIEYQEFDESKELIEFMNYLTKMIAPLANRVDVVSVAIGSVIIRLLMSKFDILTLLEKYVERSFIEWPVDAIQIEATPEEFLGSSRVDLSEKSHAEFFRP